MRKNIIIADDHPIFRLGLRTAIQTCKEYRLEAEACDGRELLQLMERCTCDLAIIDIKMQEDEEGITLLRKIKERYPHVKVVIISQLYKKSLIEEAVALGVDGYITKEDIPDSIIYILQQVSAGNKFFSSKVQQIIMGEYISDGMKTEQLTRREIEILKLLTDGYKRKEIAEKLDIAGATVDFHQSNIKAKLAAENLVDVIKTAKKRGLV